MKWPEVSLLDALASAEVFVDGDWVESKDQDPEGDVRLLQLADVGDGEYIDKSDRFLTSSKARALRCTYLKPGDVMVARMPDPLGRACIFPGDEKAAVTVVDVCIIRPNAREHDARWLMRCLNAPDCRNQIAGYATGTTRSRISRGNLGKIRIPLPPLAEQRRIAEVLDRAEALRAKRRAALAQLDSLTQSLFLDLFGDPATNPKGWPKITLGDALVAIRNGANAEQRTEPGGWPITRIETIADGTINMQRVRWIEPDDSLTDGFQLQPGDILFSHINSVEHIAKTALYSGVPTPLIHGINLLRLRPKLDSVDPVWLLHLLKHDVVRSHFRNRCKRAVNQASLNQPDIKSLGTYLPPIPLQREFARRVTAVEALKTAQRASLAELDALFATLQHRAFRGEL